jgi:hypothetical protein
VLSDDVASVVYRYVAELLSIDHDLLLELGF